MINKIKDVFNDYYKSTIITAVISMITALLFALFNGLIGIISDAPWNLYISVYYLLLIIVRMETLIFEKKAYKNNNNEIRKKAYIASFCILMVLNIALIGPIVLMIKNLRPGNIGMILSIAMAAYSFTSITIAIINAKKSIKHDNLLVKQNRIIDLISALVSILILQHTLIVVNGDYTQDLVIMSVFTSAAIWAFIVFITIISFVKNIKDNKYD
ncbi:MAG: hypothetical protein MSH40_03905 [Christensenella sp.]|nr:hypothetical protein [Christensenella sp.]